MLLLISLLIIPLALSTALRASVAYVLPVFACAAVLALYLLAMAGATGVFPWLAYAAALLCLAWVVWAALHGKGAQLWAACKTHTLTPGLLAFVLLAVFFISRQQAHGATAPDDLRYWAVEAKRLFEQNSLAGRMMHLSPRVQMWPPALPLFQWLGASVAGQCGDGLLFGMLNLFYAIFLLPLTVHIKWRRAWLLPFFLLFAVALPTVVSRDAYAMLRPDAALGVCLGYCLYTVWRLCRAARVTGFDAVSLGLGLFLLPLIDQNGILWALMPVSLLLLIWRGFERPMRVARWLAVAAPLLAFGSWQLYCLADGAQNPLWPALGQLFTQLGAGSKPAALAGFPAALWQAAMQVQMNGEGAIPSPVLGIPLIGWGIALLLLPSVLVLAGRQTVKRMVSLSLWTAACLTVYLLLFTLAVAAGLTGPAPSFVSVGTGEAAYLLERFASPGLIGALVLAASMVLAGEPVSRLRMLTISVAFATLLALTANWQTIYRNLCVAGYPLETTDEIVATRHADGWPTGPYPAANDTRHSTKPQ